MDFEESRELRRCARCGKHEMRCVGVDVSRHDRRTLLAARYRCQGCGHAIKLGALAWGRAILALLGLALFTGVPARVFVHEMLQLSGGPGGHGWYEWLMNGGLLLGGLALGGGVVFAARSSIVSVVSSLRNPVVGAAGGGGEAP
jgi:hypothetical protein